MYYPLEINGYCFSIELMPELLIDNGDEFMVMYMDLFNDRHIDPAKKRKLGVLLTAMVTYMNEESFKLIEDKLPTPLEINFGGGFYSIEIYDDDSSDDFISKFLHIVEKNLLLRGFEMELKELFDYYGIEETNFLVTGIFSMTDLTTNGDVISEEFNGCVSIHDGIYGLLNEFDYNIEKFFDYYIGEME